MSVERHEDCACPRRHLSCLFRRHPKHRLNEDNSLKLIFHKMAIDTNLLIRKTKKYFYNSGNLSFRLPTTNLNNFFGQDICYFWWMRVNYKPKSFSWMIANIVPRPRREFTLACAIQKLVSSILIYFRGISSVQSRCRARTVQFGREFRRRRTNFWGVNGIHAISFAPRAESCFSSPIEPTLPSFRIVLANEVFYSSARQCFLSLPALFFPLFPPAISLGVGL